VKTHPLGLITHKLHAFPQKIFSLFSYDKTVNKKAILHISKSAETHTNIMQNFKNFQTPDATSREGKCYKGERDRKNGTGEGERDRRGGKWESPTH